MTTTLTTNLHAVDAFARKPALIDASCAPQVMSMLSADPRSEEGHGSALQQLAGAYGLGPYDSSGKSFIFGAGIAVIPVWGALLHRDRWVSSWATGYAYIERALSEALADDDVKGIVWDVNSYGGHVSGNFELCDLIQQARTAKPMLAIVDSRALSGGYSIPSAVGRIVATPSADIGSIGVVLMHVSYEKYLDDLGVKTTFVFAGEHKVDGNPYEDLPDNVRSRLQADVDRSYKDFVSLVASSRGIEESAVQATQAAIFSAEEAKSLGLIDDVAHPRAAFAAFQKELESGSPSLQTKKAKAMTDTTDKNEGKTVSAEQIEKSAADARDNERARIKGITTHAEAAGREQLAQHFAYNTSMSVEDAAVALAAAPKAAAAEPTKDEPKQGRLAAAMESETNQSVGLGGEDKGKKAAEEGNRGGRLVTALKKATGRGPAGK